MASLINRQIIFPEGRTNAKQCYNGGRKSMRLRHHQEVPMGGSAAVRRRHVDIPEVSYNET